MRTLLPLFVASAVVVGCGPSSVINEWEPAEITDSESLRYWASGSAPQVYITTSVSMFGLLAAADEAAEGGCPVRTVEGDVTVIKGDCTDSAGRTWTGKLTITGENDPESGISNMRFEDFRFVGPVNCENGDAPNERFAINGTAVVTADGDNATLTRFNYDLRYDQTSVDTATCAVEVGTQAISYSGTIEDLGERTEWNGSGKIGNSTEGRVEVSTTDEILDNTLCNNEAVGGTTTVKGKNGTAVITYDGASACTEDATITWTLDGEAMGTVAGISCSAASGAPFGLALLLLAGLRRRRATARV